MNEGSEQQVLLWRGDHLSNVEAMEAKGSAGGRTPRKDTPAPDRAASQARVGFGGRLTEFPTSQVDRTGGGKQSPKRWARANAS